MNFWVLGIQIPILLFLCYFANLAINIKNIKGSINIPKETLLK